MALVLFEKPTAPKRVPANGYNPAAFGFHFVLNPVFVDEMHDDADRQPGADGKKKNLQAIHGENQRLRSYCRSLWLERQLTRGRLHEARTRERQFQPGLTLR